MSTDNPTLEEAIASPRAVALYMALEYQGFSVMEVRYVDYDEHWQQLPEGQKRESTYSTYARVSEIVTLPALTAVARDQVVASAVQALAAQEKEAYDTLEQSLARIRKFKSQLLALTHNPDPTPEPSGPQAGDERLTA